MPQLVKWSKWCIATGVRSTYTTDSSMHHVLLRWATDIAEHHWSREVQSDGRLIRYILHDGEYNF